MTGVDTQPKDIFQPSYDHVTCAAAVTSSIQTGAAVGVYQDCGITQAMTLLTSLALSSGMCNYSSVTFDGKIRM
jgi:hypothetical protein